MRTSIIVLPSLRHRMTHLSSRKVTLHTASQGSPISRMKAPVLKSEYPEAPKSAPGSKREQLRGQRGGKGARRTPELDSSVVPTRDDEPVVELKAGDRIVMRAQAVSRLKRREVEDDDATVRAACDEDVRDGVKLELPNERSVALEEGKELAARRGSWSEAKS